MPYGIYSLSMGSLFQILKCVPVPWDQLAQKLVHLRGPSTWALGPSETEISRLFCKKYYLRPMQTKLWSQNVSAARHQQSSEGKFAEPGVQAVSLSATSLRNVNLPRRECNTKTCLVSPCISEAIAIETIEPCGYEANILYKFICRNLCLEIYA